MSDTNTRLDGRVALVTGAARRIGAAIARELHAAGADLVLHYRASHEAARTLAAELNALRAGSALTVSADLLDPTSPARLVAAALAHRGRLDVLVNNASSFFATPLGSIDTAAWDDLIGTNLKAPLFLSQAAAPALGEGGGSIVNLVDIHAEHPIPEHPVYCAAKAGLVALTRALARDMAPRVRVNGVAPGAILWPDDLAQAERERALALIPLERTGEAADIARAVRFLAAEATYTTGHVLVVDGGRSA